MPFVRPDLQTLIERAQADIQSRLPGTQPQLRRSLTGVIARMEAGVAHGLYGYLDWLALQLMPEGAKWKLYIPSELAYGAQGAGEMIPPHSTLVFEVELLKILSK